VGTGVTPSVNNAINPPFAPNTNTNTGVNPNMSNIMNNVNPPLGSMVPGVNMNPNMSNIMNTNVNPPLGSMVPMVNQINPGITSNVTPNNITNFIPGMIPNIVNAIGNPLSIPLPLFNNPGINVTPYPPQNNFSSNTRIENQTNTKVNPFLEPCLDDPNSLKIRNKKLIDSLYTSIAQCDQCGLRFRDTDKKKKSSRLAF